MKGYLPIIHLFLCMSVLAINGQTVLPHQLCRDTRGEVAPGRWGTVKYDGADQSARSCYLTLRGFEIRKHISLPGLDLSQPAGNCHTYPKVTVNNLVYCVKGNKSNNKVVIQLVGGQMVVKVDSMNSKSFSFNYYSNVAACGEYIDLVPNRTDQLSGILVGAVNLNQRVGISKREQCLINLFNLPSPPVTVRFDLLYTSGPLPAPIQFFGKKFTEGQTAGNSLLVNTGSVDRISLSVAEPSLVQMNFLIRYTVLYCGDVAGVVAGHSLPDEPWLPGVKVNPGYSCKDHWKFNTTNPSPIECKVNDATMVAEWMDNRCIPVPGCKELPPRVDNADSSLADGNKTATYSCKEGYVTGSTKSERKSQCSSPDHATVPWTWSPVDFVCTEHRCLSPPPSVPSATYIRNDDAVTATYTCMEGYTSSTNTRTVSCTFGPDGETLAWASPSFSCIPDTSVGMAVGVTVGVLVLVALVIFAAVWWRKRTNNRTQILSLTGIKRSGKRNVYDDLPRDFRRNPDGEPAESPYGATRLAHTQEPHTNRHPPPPVPQTPPPARSANVYGDRAGVNEGLGYAGEMRGYGYPVIVPPAESVYHTLDPLYLDSPPRKPNRLRKNIPPPAPCKPLSLQSLYKRSAHAMSTNKKAGQLKIDISELDEEYADHQPAQRQDDPPHEFMATSQQPADGAGDSLLRPLPRATSAHAMSTNKKAGQLKIDISALDEEYADHQPAQRQDDSPHEVMATSQPPADGAVDSLLRPLPRATELYAQINKLGSQKRQGSGSRRGPAPLPPVVPEDGAESLETSSFIMEENALFESGTSV